MSGEGAQVGQEGQVFQDKPVVLQVLPALESGGVEWVAVETAQAVAAAGWGSLVASSGGLMVREVTRGGAEHLTLPLATKNLMGLWANVSRLRKVIRERKVRLIHAHSRAPAWSAYFAARREGIPFVTSFHGAYGLGPMRLKRPYNRVMTKGDRVVAVSNFIADHIRRNYEVEDERLRVIHGGVDMSRFDPARVSAERMIQLSQKWRLPDGVPVILVPGRLTRLKGQDVVIDALAQMGTPDVRCVLVGSDQGRTKYTEFLMERVRRLKLERIVQLVGECNDMPAAYMLANVVVAASVEPESFGRVVVEAQAMGRPVVASDQGGPRETVLVGRTGMLVHPRDVQDMICAIDWGLKMSPEDRAFVSLDAQTHIRKNFSREVTSEQMIRLYREVLGLG